MFHAPMGRFQLELVYFNYQFFHRRLIQQLFPERKTQMMNGTTVEKLVIKIN